MKIPMKFREQLKAYTRAGFEILSIEARRGSHWMVTFDKVGATILTTNVGDPRAIKNNIAEFKRRAAKTDYDRSLPVIAGKQSERERRVH